MRDTRSAFDPSPFCRWNPLLSSESLFIDIKEKGKIDRICYNVNERLGVLGCPKSFFRFIRKQWMHNIFRFILFYRIAYDPFCSIKIRITTFDRLDFMFFVILCFCRRKTFFGQHNI